MDWTVGNKKNSKDTNTCYLCNDQHRIHKCPKYLALDTSERFDTAKKLKLCYNCLKKDHFTSKCTSKNSCFNTGCTQRHHTTLHKHFVERAATESTSGNTQTSNTERVVKESFSGNTQTNETDGNIPPAAYRKIK